MKKQNDFILALLLVTWLLTGCGAVQFAQQIQAIDPATTLRGMSLAVNGSPGTYVLQQGEYILMGWPSGERYAWVIFNQAGNLANMANRLCGNRACPELAGDFYNWLTNNGWVAISSGAIPAGITSTIKQLAYLLSMGASFPVIPVMLMPAIVDPVQMVRPEVQA